MLAPSHRPAYDLAVDEFHSLLTGCEQVVDRLKVVGFHRRIVLFQVTEYNQA